jgi:hypothetical protein
MKTAIFEHPAVAAEAACGLIRGVADLGTREQLVKVLNEVQRAVEGPDNSDAPASPDRLAPSQLRLGVGLSVDASIRSPG